MQKLGIIGTNWITGQFVNAAREAEAFELTAVYSRTEEKAEQFKTDYTAPEANTYTTLTGFLEAGVLKPFILHPPTVYILNKPNKQLKPVKM